MKGDASWGLKLQAEKHTVREVTTALKKKWLPTGLKEGEDGKMQPLNSYEETAQNDVGSVTGNKLQRQQKKLSQ